MRNVVSRFAVRIDRQLGDAAAIKGEGGWADMSASALLTAAQRHLASLTACCAEVGSCVGNSDSHREKIAHECADVAAYLMMLADNAKMNRPLI